MVAGGRDRLKERGGKSSLRKLKSGRGISSREFCGCVCVFVFVCVTPNHSLAFLLSKALTHPVLDLHNPEKMKSFPPEPQQQPFHSSIQHQSASDSASTTTRDPYSDQTVCLCFYGHVLHSFLFISVVLCFQCKAESKTQYQ